LLSFRPANQPEGAVQSPIRVERLDRSRAAYHLDGQGNVDALLDILVDLRTSDLRARRRRKKGAGV